MTEYVTPNIHTVLKKYQTSAPKSLQGPGHALTVTPSAASSSSVAACPPGTNCPLDSSQPNDLSSPVGGLRGTAALSPGTPSAALATGGGGSGKVTHNNNNISANNNNQRMSPGVGVAGAGPPHIKKEIISSPEPHDMAPANHEAQNPPPAHHHHHHHHSHHHQPPQMPIKIMPPPPPELSQPILSAADSGSGELYETQLEGKPIGCFWLGGEMRLCLAQFLNNVLADFTLDQINRIFDELGIFCSQCTPDQLMEFKAAKILPSDVKASGLITRTDAERLCSALLHRSDRNSYIRAEDVPKGAIRFKVYHKCFGKCEGMCTPDMYSYTKPTCIMCLECNGWFSPQKFVGHVHRKVENRTCHWGFDSRNWHDYLHVALDVENRDKYQKILDELREVEIKEWNKLNYMKRKTEFLLDEPLLAGGHPLAAGMLAPPPTHQQLLAAAVASEKHHRSELLDIPAKKLPKGCDDALAAAAALDYQRYQTLMFAHCAQQQQQQQQQQRIGQMSAFRPWPSKSMFAHAVSYNAAAVTALSALPYLSQDPPVLQNPERVVRSSDLERFERTYQPNVALAPRKNILSKEREKEQRELRERERERDRERERERERIEREREREIERVRERERERSREREREVREREQRLQQLHHQQQQLQPHSQQSPPNLGEPQLRIKQERSTTPTDMLDSPPPLPPPAHEGPMEPHAHAHHHLAHHHHHHQQHHHRHSNGPTLDDEVTMPMTSPLALSLAAGQQQPAQPKNTGLELMHQRRHSLYTSNSSACSTSSSNSTTPPQQQLLPAHLPPAGQQRHLQQIAMQQHAVESAAVVAAAHMRQSPARTPTPNRPVCSPEEYSGSNEITSSTSPSPSTNAPQRHAPNAGGQTLIATVNQHAKLLPTAATPSVVAPSNATTTVEGPGRIRISKNLIMRSPTPPQTALHHHQQQQQQLLQQQKYEYEQYKHTLYAQHMASLKHQQQPSQSSASATCLNLSTSASGNVIVRPQQLPATYHGHHNGRMAAHAGTEFELSTDEESEPDSSNMLSPFKLALEALQDAQPRDRERIIQIIQQLWHENNQYRCSNAQLAEMLQKRDALNCELQEQLVQCRRQLEALRIQHQTGVIAKVEAGPSSGEELKVPLKKSLRREPTASEATSQLPESGRAESPPLKRDSMAGSPMEAQRCNGHDNEDVDGGQTNDSVSTDAKSCDLDAKEEEEPPPIKRVKHEEDTELSHEQDIEMSQETAKACLSPENITMDPEGGEESCSSSEGGQRNGDPASSGQVTEEVKSEDAAKANDMEGEQSRSSGSDGSATEDRVEKDEAKNHTEEDDDEDDEEEDERDHDGDEEEVDSDGEEGGGDEANSVRAPHSKATAATPTSPHSAATAGQLFDSSNSSDEASMKKAQMSASNALAKMAAEAIGDSDDDTQPTNDEDDDGEDGEDDDDQSQCSSSNANEHRTSAGGDGGGERRNVDDRDSSSDSEEDDLVEEQRSRRSPQRQQTNVECAAARPNSTSDAAAPITATMPLKTKASKKQSPPLPMSMTLTSAGLTTTTTGSTTTPTTSPTTTNCD